MSIYFSKQTQGFYDSEIHGDRVVEVVQTDPGTGKTVDRWMEENPNCSIPGDAVEISEKQYLEMLEGESAGDVIEADSRGRPTLKAPPPPTPDQVKARVKSMAGKLIDKAAPSWKQRNMIARAIELDHIERDAGSLSADEQSEFEAIKQAWARMKAIRDHSNALELAVDGDITTDIGEGWPA